VRGGFETASKSARAAAAASLACVVAFALLTFLAFRVAPLDSADAHVLGTLSSLEDTVIGSVASALAFFADPVPLLIILAGASWYGLRRGRVAETAAALAVVAGASLTTQVLKHLLAHERFHSFLETQPDLNSFPSGHLTAATSLALALAWVAPAARRRAVLAWGALFVAAVGVSMPVLNRHLPSDVLGGILVGLGWGFGVLAVYRALLPRFRADGNPPPTGELRASFSRRCV
jgi:membrane-associated phospholipid phosphatase